MIEIPKDEILTYNQRHPVLMKRVKWAMTILGCSQLLVCIACAVWGKNVVGYTWVEGFVRRMNWLIPAVDRLGSLSLDPEVGRFTFAVGMVISIMFGIAFLIWGLFYRTMEEQKAYWAKVSSGRKIKMLLGFLLGTYFILTDFGVIHGWVGLATAQGVYDHPEQAFTHFLLSEGVKFGIASAIFCFAIGSGYALIVGGWIKLVPAWIKDAMSGESQQV